MRVWAGDRGEPWADAMSQALAERYGHWTVGWRWSHDEGVFDGGPVGNWCCPNHSITTPQETLERVVAALWECAARKLILKVADRTGCGSGWYGHCHQVLTWFLSRWGVAPDVARALVEEAVGGRFRPARRSRWTESACCAASRSGPTSPGTR